MTNEFARKVSFFTLSPRPQDAEENKKVLARPTYKLGIEVTLPQFAGKMDVNVDPQHSDGKADVAAIEAIQDLDFDFLGAKLEERGIDLFTVRADLDSVGAMAWAAIKLLGYDNPDVTSVGVMRSIASGVKVIAEIDKSANGPWMAQQLPTMERLWARENGLEMATLAAAVADFKRPLEERVGAVGNWLMHRQVPAEYRDRVLAERQDMVRALMDGRIRTWCYGDIALVISQHRAATAVGYALRPIVVAVNPAFRFSGGEPHRKVTICQYSPGYVDLPAVWRDLGQQEAGWGGSPTIGGSPQGVSCTLLMPEILKVVRRHLLRG
ncbi:hypothetical protein IJJ12_03785 [bacterium]|nr:hypothetical protein [bacterium]